MNYPIKKKFNKMAFAAIMCIFVREWGEHGCISKIIYVYHMYNNIAFNIMSIKITTC